MILFDAISKQYMEGIPVLHEVSLNIASGKTLSLIGASGCGKTTLLKMVNRLLAPSSGKVLIDGVDITTLDIRSLRKRIGYVAQAPALFPNLRVGDNIALPLKIENTSKERMEQEVRAKMELVGLDYDTFHMRFPDELSGGQAQRACLARALITNPDILLLDEPFAALDAITRLQMQTEIKQIREAMRVTILLVTHDILEALYLGDTIAVLKNGALQQVGTDEEIMQRPANPYVRSLVHNPYAEMMRRG